MSAFLGVLRRQRWWQIGVVALVIALWLTAIVVIWHTRAPRAVPRRVLLVPAVHTGQATLSTAETECLTHQTGCARALLGLLNDERRAVSVAPLTLDWTINHTATCPGARGHARAMATTNTEWHVNDAYPAVSWPNDVCGGREPMGQNVGASWGLGKWDAIAQVHDAMMQEQHDPAFCATYYNHACNILSPLFVRVGIAIAGNAQGGWFLVESFSR